MAAVILAKGDADIRKVRHLTLGHLFIQQATRNGICTVSHEFGETLVADAMTKVLSPAKTNGFLLELGLQLKGQSGHIPN